MADKSKKDSKKNIENESNFINEKTLGAKTPAAKTLGELKDIGYTTKPVRREIQDNLISKLKKGEKLFPGIHGYDNTVLPQIIHALLSGHHIVFLGEKGQAKSRIMRAMTDFLDEYIPVIDGSPIPEDPFLPITQEARTMIEKHGSQTPIRWLRRSERYGERLSAGLKISDLIGDIDPSKIISGSPLSSEGGLHFGIIPRTNRGIFAINELPDLDYLVQVALFNIMEEGDIQIRGYPFHFPLDIIITFSANPTDYSRSGKIISQLKDRMGSEIRTHYPESRAMALEITRQESNTVQCDIPLQFPSFMEEVNEELTRQARQSRHINQKSGVSARFSIANYETLAASAMHRALLLKEEQAVVRPTDMGNIFASSLGKIELDPYRDEAITEYHLLTTLIESAFKEVFLEKFSSADYEKGMDEITVQLQSAGYLETSDFMRAEQYRELLKVIPSAFDFINALQADKDVFLMASAVEFILEGLTALKKITRRKTGQTHIFKSMDAY